MSQKIAPPKKISGTPKLTTSKTSPNLSLGIKKIPPKFSNSPPNSLKVPPKMIKKGGLKKFPPQTIKHSLTTRELPTISNVQTNKNTDNRSTVYLNANETVKIESIQPDDILFQKVDIKIVEFRDRIIEELLTSEQVYILKLLEMNRVYRLPMLEAAKKGNFMLSLKQVHNIFSQSFDDILKVNFELLKALRGRITQWHSKQLIGDILLQTLPFLKMYTIYTGGHEKALSILEEAENKESFVNFVNQCIKDTEVQDIRAYLIRPVQRVPRYRLLLEDLLKHTDDGHPDKENIAKALDKVMVIAEQINREITEQKNRVRILQIQKAFLENINIIEAGRILIKEGELIKICRKDHKKFIFWLFSDLLMYAKEMPGNRYTRNRMFPLISVSIANIDDDPNRKLTNAFQISSAKKSFIVYTTSASIKQSWLNDITRCINEIDEKMKTFQDKNKVRDIKSLAPVWVPDSESTACFICETKFNIITRKHHCRQCGQVICGKCSSRKKELPGQGKKRVCDSCYDKPCTLDNSESMNKDDAN